MDTPMDRWNRFLTELERDIAAVSLNSAAQTTPWSPPGDLGPLPRALEARTRRVLESHTRLAEQLRREQADIGRHLSALRSVPKTLASRTPIYLDIAT
jgi:hypothetical protein